MAKVKVYGAIDQCFANIEYALQDQKLKSARQPFININGICGMPTPKHGNVPSASKNKPKTKTLPSPAPGQKEHEDKPTPGMPEVDFKRILGCGG